MAQKFKLVKFQLVDMVIERLFSLYDSKKTFAAYRKILIKTCVSHLCINHISANFFNFGAKSCQSRYLFWLVSKNLLKIFLKLIKTNNVIGEIWRQNSKRLCGWAFWIIVFSLVMENCTTFATYTRPGIQVSFSC